MKDEKTKKDEYQKALGAYAEAMKDFRKGKDDKAFEALRSFIEKFPGERELVDRARLYVAICENRLKSGKEGAPLKTADDYYRAGLFKINASAYEDAQKLLDKALKLSPEAGKIHYALADLYCLTGQTEPCLEALKKAIQFDKQFRVLAQNEIDFEPLWDDKKFKVLTRIA
jgi:tetratricopeptide (TPR) repeat protein